jgi:hypothetical protein
MSTWNGKVLGSTDQLNKAKDRQLELDLSHCQLLHPMQPKKPVKPKNAQAKL